MGGLLATHPREVLACLVLLARIGDLGSTYLATPSLRFEANPIARRLGWPYAFATLAIAAIAFVPDVGIGCAVIVLVISLLVTGKNLGGAWLVRALGEERYAEILGEALARTPAWRILVVTLASGACVAAVGWLLLVFCPDPRGWPYWFAMALIGYAVAIVVFQLLFLRRAYARLRAGRPAA